MWFKLARLFLTDPTPSRYRTRLRWAADFVASLESSIGKELVEDVRSARSILRLVNALKSVEESGLAYLDDVFDQFFASLELDLAQHSEILDARQSFFDGAEERLVDRDSEMETVDNLKKMFRHPSGVVVNTCHGAKGEEYAVVVCFGLLRGYIPHWRRIFDEETDETAEARRILYVVASRAKKCIHLFAEVGRTTKSQRPYETTRELSAITWDYEELPTH
jgi:superfamily I DNA/RNA helicase